MLRGADSRRVTHHTVSGDDHEHYELTLHAGADGHEPRTLTLEVPRSTGAGPIVIRLLSNDTGRSPGPLPSLDGCDIADHASD